jgi:RhtB (resistance to homoserine/threonine) family protein
MFWHEFLIIVVVHLLAVASPDFAMVVRQSITYGRKAGFLTSIGIGLGIFVHAAYCMLGLGIIISQSIIVFNIMKWLGALYLFYIGFKCVTAKPHGLPSKKDLKLKLSKAHALRIGFLTNALNPKASLFFLALFSVVISPQTVWGIKVFYTVWMAAATMAWFFGITVLFSHDRVRNSFQKIGHWFERAMGAVLILLGIRLAFSSQH